MLVKQLLSDQRIIDCLNTYYDIEVIFLTFIPKGADMNASVFKAETKNHSTYFVKLKRGQDHDIGIDVVGCLAKAGIQEIISPIATIQGQLSLCIEDLTLIVYPYIEGQDGFSRSLTEEQWIALGKALWQVHEINLPLSIQQEIRREVFSSKWRKIVSSLFTHIESGLVGDEIALKLITFMKKNSQAILHLVERTEQLAQILQKESHEFVLCHSDIHAGNVLIGDNNTIFIVDWDEPIMAPKERDLMFIGGGVGNVWNKAEEEIFFYRGYGKTEINKMLITYYRCERIVEDIALYGQDLLLTTNSSGDREAMYQHFIAMFEPNGVVDIGMGSNRAR